MTYQEIEQVLEKFPHYTFPIQADDEEGHRIIINEGYEEVSFNDEIINDHYFRVYTYLDNGKVKTSVYHKCGAYYESIT